MRGPDEYVSPADFAEFVDATREAMAKPDPDVETAVLLKSGGLGAAAVQRGDLLEKRLDEHASRSDATQAPLT